MPKHSLSILLLKPTLASPADALKDTVAPESLDLGSAGGNGVLYWKSSYTGPPRWIGLFRVAVGDALDSVTSSSPSAVLFMRAAGRQFALTFGYGRSLLKPDAFEENFGLRVVLNCVDPAKLRSVDVNTLESVPLVRRNQSGRAASVADFGLDVDRDLLSAASGRPDDSALGKQITGKDSLRLTVGATLAELPDLLARLVSVSELEAYKERGFGWVDNLREVRSKTQEQDLERVLEEKVRSRDFSRTWLAAPDPVEWSDFDCFRYQKPKRGKSYDDISWESYLDFLAEEGDEVSADTFRKQSVLFIRASTELPGYEWKVFKCIYAEIDHDGTTFVLNNGKWYAVAHEFLDELDKDLAAIPRGKVPLPEYEDTDEAAYNARVAATRPDYYALMDKRLVMYGGGRSREEFCDLYTLDKRLIHVKRYGGSGVLSQLFNQGTVSAELLLGSPRFRRAVHALLPASHQWADPDTRPNAEDFEVVYGVVTKSKQIDPDLPLFSRITLRNARDRLSAYGFPMSLSWIRIATPGANT